MIVLPDDPKKLIPVAQEVINTCRTSAGVRAAYCRELYSVVETGRQDGTRALINKLPSAVDRTATHLFSPTDLRFTIGYEYEYPKLDLDRAQTAARVLTQDFERTGADECFQQGVHEALKYGACLFKQWVQEEGDDRTPVYRQALVMPWQFGVYNETVGELDRQPAFCETNVMTLPEAWRRIAHLPDAQQMFERIRSHSQKGDVTPDFNTFFHQVLSTSQIDTSATGGQNTTPGGIVALNANPNFSIIEPAVGAQLVKFHELWIWGEDDWITIQLFEPDIIVNRFRKSNLLVANQQSGLHPYTKIQPNKVANYFWGKSEIADLIEPQGLLSTWSDDARRLMGLQIDKIVGFEGYDGLTDEVYDQMRGGGYLKSVPGSQIKDLTPKFPPELMPLIQFIMSTMDGLGGFENILAGRGETGIRSGLQADVATRNASPRLRNRSLLVERQCAQAADLRFSLMQYKDARKYWTDANEPDKTAFLLVDLPKDWRVAVDSHSSSPIFMNDHRNELAFMAQAGVVDGEALIENSSLPNKDLLIQRYRQKQEAQAKQFQMLMQVDPQAAAKSLTGKKR